MVEDLTPYSYKDVFRRWALSVIMLPIIIYWCANRGEYGLLDNADLVIHEGGHYFFMWFGKFVYTLGGSLMQIILPSTIVYYFLIHYYRPGVQIFGLWLGQNLINISVYAADAQAQKLPLLGGNKVYHDWRYILGDLHILEYDQEVGYFFFGLAILVFIAVLLMPMVLRDNK